MRDCLMWIRDCNCSSASRDGFSQKGCSVIKTELVQRMTKRNPQLDWRDIESLIHVTFEGVGGGTPPEGLIELASVAFADVVRFDRTIFPADREAFLRRWIHQKKGAALAIAGADGIRGYGVLRACRRGCKIGPLFADDPLANASSAASPRAPPASRFFSIRPMSTLPPWRSPMNTG